MDFASENVPEILRPEFHTGDCWFAGKWTDCIYYRIDLLFIIIIYYLLMLHFNISWEIENSLHIILTGKGAFLLYYYGIKSICIISSICLSISTAVKIARYEKETGLRLTDSESKRYNDNKKWSVSNKHLSMCNNLSC